MSIAQSIANFFAPPAPVVTSFSAPPEQRAATWQSAPPATKSLTDFLRGTDAEIGGGATLSNAYQQSVWVHACIRLIAETVSQIPFRFSRGQRGGEDVIESGDIVRLFDRPHAYLDRFLFWEYLVTYALLRGKVFVIGLDKAGSIVPLARAGRRVPREILFLNPDRIQEQVSDHAIQHYRYTSGTRDPIASQNFLREDPLCLRYPNPSDFFGANSPAGVAQLAAQTDYASAQFIKGLIMNNADNGVIVRMEGQPAPEDREMISAALRERKRSAGTPDRPLFLWGGMTLERPGLSAADLQFLENRNFAVREICAVFGVPQELLGLNADANRAIHESVRLGFIENRILPFVARLEAFIDPVVKLFGQDLYGWFDVDALPIMQTARRARFQSAFQYAFQMGVPVEDCSKLFGLGLSELPHGRKSFLPFGLQEVGEKAAPAAPEPASDVSESIKNAVLNLRRALQPPPPSAPVPHTCATPSAYADSIEPSIRQKRVLLKSLFFKQSQRVLAALERELKSGEAVAKALKPQALFDTEAEYEVFAKRFKPVYLADLEFGGAQLFKEVGALDFKIRPSAALNFLQSRQNDLREVQETTFEKIRGELTAGLEAGEGYEEIAARIRPIFRHAENFRADTIAITETNIAVNAGRFEGLKQSGVEKKAWATSSLDGVRATHVQAGVDYAAGIPLEEDFIVGGEHLAFPGDPRGGASNVINCRCFTQPVIGGKALNSPRLLSFSEWLAQRAHLPQDDLTPADTRLESKNQN